MMRSRSKSLAWGVWIFLLLLFLLFLLLGSFFIGAKYQSNEYFSNIEKESHYKESIPSTSLVLHVIYPQRIRYDAAAPEHMTLLITDSSNYYKKHVNV